MNIFYQNYHTCFQTNLSEVNFTHIIKETIQAQELMLLIHHERYCVSYITNMQPTQRQRAATLYTDGLDGFLSGFNDRKRMVTRHNLQLSFFNLLFIDNQIIQPISQCVDWCTIL
jgi:hypothetical protein